ncbi:hypothetical protein ONZ45_g2202 [Pleurotus djamor]|nr:hypothetical protein ONZ45_g18689 [Pleurotus djamor]KAJ8521057.1 hypothetical protein ONZ45_g2202 [Pleurotus djamor]
MGGITSDYDPLDIVTAPPVGESPEARAVREKREAEAKRISDRIDEDIKLEKVALKKQKNVLRVLLLGQAESGKSTTLKNFRLKYAYNQWLQERASWRAVIQLNLIRSVLAILDALQAEMNEEPPFDPIQEDDDDSALDLQIMTVPRVPSSKSEFVHHHPTSTTPPLILNEKHKLLLLRLSPLRRIETILRRRLGAGSDEVRNAPAELMQATPFESPQTAPARVRRTAEFVVRTWNDALYDRSGNHTEAYTGEPDSDDVTEVLAGCKDDMVTLWHDPDTRKVLKRRNMYMEASAGFFLEDLERIATRSYEPSDDDVVRARLRTTGIQEHKILFEQGHEFGREWVIYDVGGARTMRYAWLPFFDNVNAVIFLAPVSCFDERLEEDHKINRLEDSFILWRAVVSAKLLQKATMIVFLNKCDILKKKLKSGILVKKHLTSYGERPNDASSIVKYLRDKFKDILKQYSPEPRMPYLYPTSVTDTKATSTTLRTVRDGIMREHLKNADFV